MSDSCGSSSTPVINFFIKILDVICYVEAISFHYEEGSHDYIQGASVFLELVASWLIMKAKCNRGGWRESEVRSDANFV